jgi:hypothetical protein
MQQQELPKSIKKALRSVCDVAHEAELRRALDNLSQDFDRWKEAEIDSFELADRIHKFHNGANRGIFLRYARGLDLRLLVSRAIHEGLIPKDSVPKEIFRYLEKSLSFLGRAQ